jgi:hypothetical protein
VRKARRLRQDASTAEGGGAAGRRPEVSETASEPTELRIRALRGRWSLVTAIVLSATTLASAWAGYEATRWAGHAHDDNRSAAVTRFAAQRAANAADRQQLNDLQVFATWFAAEVGGSSAVADATRARFRSEFVPAFDAWLGNASGPDLPAGSPFDRPEYVLASQTQSDELTAKADGLVALADDASDVGERYVLVAVLYASVLFLAGIANQMNGRRAIWLTGVLAVAAFIGAVSVTAMLPVSLPG